MGLNLRTAPRDLRDRVLFSPIIGRPKISWPDEKPLAFWVSPNVEHYEYTPPARPGHPLFARMPQPDVEQYAYRDYGNRVGFWRMAAALDEYDVRVTVSLNLAVFEHFPQVGAAMQERQWSYMSHGIYNTRALFDYSEEEEREFFEDNKETLMRHTGQTLRGMLGPATSATINTFDLMADAGLRYSADWYHDDQPAPILTKSGRMVSVPYSLELNDRNPAIDGWLEILAERTIAQFDRMLAEGQRSGLVMCLALHPFMIGQPHMVGYLHQVLDHVMSHDGVWHATADEIVDWYLEHCYDEQLEYAASVSGGARTDAR